MKLLLDTAYLLPAVGIFVKDLPKEALIRLIQEGHKVYISDISIFELTAKAAKYVVSGILPGESVARGIRAIVYGESVEVVSTHDTDVLLTAFKLRSLLEDSIDCIVLSTAINRCECLVTEDEDLLNLKKESEYSKLYETINPRFMIQKVSEVLRKNTDN